MRIPEPMDRLAGELNTAAEALRGAMHAITDLPAADGTRDDWYQQCQHLNDITVRVSELLDAVADHIGYLWPDPKLHAADQDAQLRIHLAVTELHDAARLIGRANRSINAAWTQVGNLGMRPEAGGS